MSALHTVIEPLHPAYFDIVMATGIVAIAAQFENIEPLAIGLTWLNAVLFVALFGMNLLRAMCFPKIFFGDLAHFKRGPGFFTMVAAFAIVGNQAVLIWHNFGIALGLWIASLILWAGFNYAIFTDVTLNQHKPRFEEGISGGWLVSVVATQAVAGLGAELSGMFSDPSKMLLFACGMWLAGAMLYIWLIALIFYRFTFFPFKPEDFVPPFWINMGAMAISALTGATLAEHAGAATFLQSMLPAVKILTLLFWATASWWIPLLAIFAAWQHLIKRINRPYNLLYWSAIFPLGMYTAATFQLARILDLGFLMSIPAVFIYIALVSWIFTFAAMVHSGAMQLTGWLGSQERPSC